MLSIRESSLSKRNAQLHAWERKQPTESNSSWLARALEAPEFRETELAIILIGGRTSLDLSLRFAQSMARYDRSPSSWSEVALLVRQRGKRRTHRCYGMHLPAVQEPMAFDGDRRLLRNVPTWNNGVQDRVDQAIDNPVNYPNIGVFGFSEARLEAIRHRCGTGNLAKAAGEVIENYCRRADVISGAESAWRWLGYAWGIRGQHNPLSEGLGLPSAMFVESVLSALGVDLTPGLASHSSCPEAIWQTFCWWHTADAADSDKPSGTGETQYFGKYLRSHIIDEARP